MVHRARETSSADADASIKQLRDLGFEFVDADWNLAKDAAYFKSRNKMSFADCFAAALARQRKAHLASGDPEFKQVEGEITISWLYVLHSNFTRHLAACVAPTLGF